MRDMGIACGQGYFIARPERLPSRQLAGRPLTALDQQSSPCRHADRRARQVADGAHLLKPIGRYCWHASNAADVIARFEAEPIWTCCRWCRGCQPVGMINRHSMIDRFARPFRKELFPGARVANCSWIHAPLVVDQHATIQELAMMLSLAPKALPVRRLHRDRRRVLSQGRQQPRPDGDDHRNVDRCRPLRQLR